jgi:MFS family permease
MGRLIAILCSIGMVGMSQGLVIPLLALLLERRGASALFNGVSTTALFLGVIVASPFIERFVRRFGARRTILYSTVFSIVMTLAFPLWQNVYAWIIFRLLLGIGLAGLFVATEIWLNRLLTSKNRGRFFAFYGLAIALGMMIGPQGINLIEISEGMPFYVSAVFYLIPLLITARISDEDSELEPVPHGEQTGIRRWWRIFLLAPFAMCASLVYGYLDGALVGDFPIYGARLGLSDASISGLLTVFVFGSIVFQFPLGWLSDRWGRRQTLLLAAVVGFVGFALLPALAHVTWQLMAAFFCLGGALGSFYSLGLAYLGDLIGGSDIPTANVLYTMIYGVGSLTGPSVTGFLIYQIGKETFAWSIAGMLLLYVAYGLVQSRRARQAVSDKGFSRIGSHS